MLPADQGRFCNHCQHEIIDFSKMSDAEILRVLDQPNAPKCGRWHKSQLNRALQPAAHSENRIWPRLAVGAMLFFAAMPHALLAQQPQSNSATFVSVPIKDAQPNFKPLKDGFKIFSGSIRDRNTLEPIYFATISINDSNIDYTTNDDGRFEIKIPTDQFETFFEYSVSYEGHTLASGKIMMDNIPQMTTIDLDLMKEEDCTVGKIVRKPLTAAEKREARRTSRMVRRTRY